MNKYKVTAVSYLNTKPFLYGIFKSGLEELIDLQLDIPSECARKLKDGKVDFGLVPVAILPELKNYEIISEYCIGSKGKVRTVCIFSQCPIEEITGIYLDYHSSTSVELTKILLADYWKLVPKIMQASPGYEENIKGTIAGLVIGDRAIDLEHKFSYRYDLGEIWQKHTGLPFVFAVWVSTKPLPEDFIKKFNAALALGISQIPQLVYLIPDIADGFDLQDYFTHNISYDLDESKKRGMEKFLSIIAARIHINNDNSPLKNYAAVEPG